MVVNNFNLINAIFSPLKTYTPLIIDANAVLSLTVAFESFQPVRRWNFEIVKIGGCVKHNQLSLGNPLNILGQLLGELPFEYFFSFLVFESLNHVNNNNLL